jgi:hypothetical protein
MADRGSIDPMQYLPSPMMVLSVLQTSGLPVVNEETLELPWE